MMMDEETVIALIAAPIFARRTGPESNRLSLAIEEAFKIRDAVRGRLTEEVAGLGEDQGAVSSAHIDREASDDLSDLLGEG